MARKKKTRSVPSTSKPIQLSLATAAPTLVGAKGAKKKKKRVSRHIHPYAQMLIDPRTAKLDYAHPPDSNPKPTVVFRSTLDYTAQVDSNGCLWTEIRALPAGFRQRWSMSTTAGTISTDSGVVVHSDNTALQSSFSALRPMALAVEIEYVGEAQLAKGTLALVVSDNPAAVGWTMEQMTDEPYYKEISASHPGSVAAVARYAPSEFYAMSATALGTGHPRIFVLADGLPTTAFCVRVRTTMVVEYLCPANSIMQTQARYSPNLPLEYASAQSMNKPEAVMASGENAWEKLKKAARAVYDVASRLNYGAGNYDYAQYAIEL